MELDAPLILQGLVALLISISAYMTKEVRADVSALRQTVSGMVAEHRKNHGETMAELP